MIQLGTLETSPLECDTDPVTLTACMSLGLSLIVGSDRKMACVLQLNIHMEVGGNGYKGKV